MTKSRHLIDHLPCRREAAVWVNCLFLPCPEIKVCPTVTVPVKETVCARSFHHFKTVGDESEASGSGKRQAYGYGRNRPADSLTSESMTAMDIGLRWC